MIKNVSNVSFGSTYKVSNDNNNAHGFLKFEELCAGLEGTVFRVV